MPITLIKSDPRAREKPCLRCGYSLRKLESTHCPECGLSVWLSLNQNDTLDWSNPPWLRRMSLGLLIMVGGSVLGLIAYCFAIPHYVAMWTYHEQLTQAIQNQSFVLTAMAPPTPNYFFEFVSMVLAMGYLLAYCGGLVFLTWNEDRHPDRLKTTRIASWVVGGVAAVVALVVLMGMFSPLIRLFWWFLVKIVAVAAGFVTWAHLRVLARRVPNSTIAKVCGWLLLIPVLGAFKVFPFFTFYVVGMLVGLIDFLPLVYLPGSAILFAWFALTFRRNSVEAEKNWAAETMK